jgi:hypothetical protein
MHYAGREIMYQARTFRARAIYKSAAGPKQEAPQAIDGKRPVTFLR